MHRQHTLASVWSRHSPDLSRLRLAFLDDPLYFAPLLGKLVRLGVPVVGICHNIESLVYGQVRDRHRAFMFSREITLLKRCAGVITISREEDVCLRNLGVRTFYLPYHPILEIEKALLSIRAERGATPKNGFLIMGNMINPPTRQGLITLVEYWHQHRLAEKFGPLTVTGHNFQNRFQADLYPDSICFRGTLGPDEYHRVLTRTKALISYQQTGAGALTRIREMLAAGIPVLCNPHAGRSHYNLPGVHEFSDLSALPRAIEALGANPGIIPLMPRPDLLSLTEFLRTLEKPC